MPQPFRATSLFFSLIFLSACAHANAIPVSASPALTEDQKIEKLIAIVAAMKDAQFIRKGTPYDCTSAARFMRAKWSWKSSEIKTAKDFVRICSAGGSGEGTPYYIRFADGKQVATKAFLGEQLGQIEAAESAVH